MASVDQAQGASESTGEELAFYDDVSRLAESLWNKSKGMVGLNTDPRMFSNALFRRLWSNHRGYTLLWKDRFTLESDILLRSALEAAICIAALVQLREEFVLLMRRDAAHTVLGQIKLNRDNGSLEAVAEGEATVRLLQSGLPLGVKPAKLVWSDLAKAGSASHLYDWHRRLSGLSSHVTGVSILTAFGGDGMDEKQAELKGLQRRLHLIQMAAATLHGSQNHATMHGFNEDYDISLELFGRLDALSFNLPGVT
jgi:hypothetical protein